MMRSCYLALVHHPVRDRHGGILTTAVTNLDVHDIARSCRTYDLARYFVVTPIEAQRALVERILGHWRDGSGARRVPERSDALANCLPIASVEDAIAAIAREHGAAPQMIGTAARSPEGARAIDYAEAARQIERCPTLLLFGTGHGLDHGLLRRADGVLPPIRPRGYNHLSVRAAVAITLDRLFGDERAD